MKIFVFRGIMFLIVIFFLEVIGYAGMWLNSRANDIVSNKNYFQIRAMLIGDENPEHFPRYLSLPYLGYIQYPGYKRHGLVQNNESGYRGETVPVERTDKFRVLCLGGSTTYGFMVDSPSQAYPARLQGLLNTYILADSVLSKKYKGVEVINAGLEAGTSAEELQQYIFKYRYYKADLVIIHSGVNDAMIQSTATSDFQLDYTHYRKLNFHLEPLTNPARWMLHSYLFSFISIRLFYENFMYNGVNGKDCFSRQQYQHLCMWSHMAIDSVIYKKQYDFVPFYRNSKSLFSSVLQDSATLIVFPGAVNKKSDFVLTNNKYNKMTTLNSSLSRSLADESGAVFLPFTFDSIKDPSTWTDDCHLNARGEENKAEIVFRAVRNQLSKR